MAPTALLPPVLLLLLFAHASAAPPKDPFRPVRLPSGRLLDPATHPLARTLASLSSPASASASTSARPQASADDEQFVIVKIKGGTKQTELQAANLAVEIGDPYAENTKTAFKSQREMDKALSRGEGLVEWYIPVFGEELLSREITALKAHVQHVQENAATFVSRSHVATSFGRAFSDTEDVCVDLLFVLVNAFVHTAKVDPPAILAALLAANCPPGRDAVVCSGEAGPRSVVVHVCEVSGAKDVTTFASSVVGMADQAAYGVPEVVLVSQKLVMAIKNKWGVTSMQSASTDGLQSDGSNAPVWLQGINGQGMKLGVADTGVTINNCYFINTDGGSASSLYGSGGGCNDNARKVECLWKETSESEFGEDGSGHGTHVSGTAAGLHILASSTGTADITQLTSNPDFDNGNAPSAKLLFTSIGVAGTDGSLQTPDDFASANFFARAYNRGARAHSNSWGCSSSSPRACNVYDFSARSMDEFVWNNRDMVVLVAAGNDGDYSPAENIDGTTIRNGLYTIGTPSTFKNGITVGASQSSRFSTTSCGGGLSCSLDNQAYFSGRGYTFDGRIKPEVLAPGEDIISARNLATSCDAISPFETVINTGTSMATPGVAGAVILVQQYYKEYNPATGGTGTAETLSDGKGPSAALVKATIINSAISLAGQTTLPSSGLNQEVRSYSARVQVEGFGRVKLDQTLNFGDRSLIVFDRYELDDDEEHDFLIEIEQGGSLKVTLVYTDAPGPITGTFSTTKVLVNNLDLSLTCVSGFCPSLPNPASSTTNAEQIPVPGQSDSDYTAITFAEASSVTISVKGTDVPSGPQPYALVISGTGLSWNQSANDVPESIVPGWGSEAVLTAGSGDSPCFPGAASVELESGKHIPMERLAIGDRVRVSPSEFSDIIAFTHKDSRSALYVGLTTASGRHVFASPTHYIFASGRLVTADMVVVGEMLETDEGVAEAVTRVVHGVRLPGVYNPHTASGVVYVDGLKASCYTSTVPPVLAEMLLVPVRAYYSLTGKSLIGGWLEGDALRLAAVVSKVTSALGF